MIETESDGTPYQAAGFDAVLVISVSQKVLSCDFYE